MRVLVACEFSGIVRDAFKAKGHDAWSCDLLPTERPGHFIFRCMKIAEVDEWSNLVGKTIRVKYTHSKVVAIGHIVKNDWFNPSEDFATVKNGE